MAVNQVLLFLIVVLLFIGMYVIEYGTSAFYIGIEKIGNKLKDMERWINKQ